MNVLIAEDDYRVAMIQSEYIQSIRTFHLLGHVLNAKELFMKLESENIDLLLLDLYFPDIEREELLRQIRMKYLDLDIIVISASDDVDILQQAKRCGVVAFLQKPVDACTFKETMNNYLEEQTFLNGSHTTFSQADSMRILGGLQKETTERFPTPNLLPSGIDALTLERVYDALKREHDGLTIERTCEAIGISRTTARRYLEHLLREKDIYTQINYGEIGRPERRYCMK
ncbi:response regulator [Alkalihalobacillus sp. LMS6]|uniref:response regulator n=1 Tax=Alkalihalobacillus sp. LMS6 TaxID=2924034 RepID=UPI0020D1D859|nr:response regulator [Alkalihalobacillus sp. LMS6]UTR06217.1 response regulator [Alkalihalobacillus sp. LMS6]